MKQLILHFNEPLAAERSKTGGKGATLAYLFQSGFPVPDGFIISPSAFTAEGLTEETKNQVREQMARLRRDDTPAALAVRSSALSEDAARDSYAGEFKTFLDVTTEQALFEAVDSVYHSRKSERVLAYSQAKGAESDHEIAVVVQQMIPSEISGVLFTADPITGSHAVMTANFVCGLGEQLVSGAATGEQFTLQRPGGDYQGPPELKRYAREFFKLASRLERELGGPQDIEWAISDGKLHLLQSRPITTLTAYDPVTGAWNDTLTCEFLWSNVNFGEAVTEPMTPLAWSVLKLILEEWEFIPGYPTVGNIGGRPYLNISVFATVFSALRRSRDDLLDAFESTLYMRLPEEMDIPLIPLSRRSMLSSLFNAFRIQRKQNRGIRDIPLYLKSNPAWFASMRQQLKELNTTAALRDLWYQEIKPHVTKAVWGVLGSATSAADYALQLRRDLTPLVGAEDADTLISSLSGEQGLLESLGPVVSIFKIAHGELSREAYLERYGHRGPHEFELSIPRPAEDPDWLDRQLTLVAGSSTDVEALLIKRRNAFEAAWERLQAHHPGKTRALRRRIDEMSRRARRREQARSEYSRDRWLMRLFALRAGELTGLSDDVFFLTFAELLEALSGDSTAVETIPARKKTYDSYKALPSYPSVIRGRFDPFAWSADPERRGDIYDACSQALDQVIDETDPLVIRGAPGAAGKVEAIVRRLDNSAEAHLLQDGEILVTVQTDIAWTVLFPRAAAVITDVGAPLSHAAIVARELGIPAVVGCGDATMRLKSGDRVLVDGGQGMVKILEKAAIVEGMEQVL